MPVTIKVSQIKYKDNNGNYVGINGVAEQSTQEEIAEITEIGATTLTSIETKGQQTLDSIPSDYTELSNKVSRTTDTTRNLWAYERDVYISNRSITLDINIPAGTYTISALVERDLSYDSGNCRFTLYGNSVASSEQLYTSTIAPNVRSKKTFTISSVCKKLVLFSGANASLSTDVPATWKDLQLDAGESASKYIPHDTATDYIVRENFESFSEKKILFANEVITGNNSETVVELPDYNNIYTETPIISCDASFTRNSGITDYPRIQIRMNNNRNLERYTTWYKIGKEEEYEIKEWRAPSYGIWEDKTVKIAIYVPTGCTLTIRRMWYRFDSSIDRASANNGITFFARPGNCNMVPELTYPSLQMAARAGYNVFTVVPKVSSDGVWFAYHDDTWDIETTGLGNPDGSAIVDTQYNGDYFHEIPFSYLDQFRYRKTGSLFYSVKILKLEDCFAFLAKTGMKLRFSLHPTAGINTTAKLTELKRLVQKYGLLKDLTIIVNDIASVFPVFGNDIGGYSFANSTGSNWDGTEKRVDVALTNAISARNTYNITVPISCSLWSDSLFANRSRAESLVSDILDEGFKAGVFSYTFTGIDGSSHGYLWSEDMLWLMSIGVTEFTDGYNTSVGLNW